MELGGSVVVKGTAGFGAEASIARHIGKVLAHPEHQSSVKNAAYAALSAPWRHTGIPSLWALSARLAEMPEPGKAMRPAGSASSI